MRKFREVTIETEGRDRGKRFLIVEMPAMAAEKWAAKALLALGRAGVEVPEETAQQGAAAVLSAGLSAFRQMRFEDAEPLLDDMLNCVSVVIDGPRDPLTGRPVSRPLLKSDDYNDGDVEEMATLLKLRGEVLDLHVGFSVTAALSGLGAARSGASRPPRTRTSRKASARS